MLLEGESLVFRYGEYLFATQEYGKTEFPLSGDRYEEIKKDGILAHKNQYAQDVFVFRNENQTTKSYIDNMYSEYDKLISEAFESARRSYGSKYKLKMDRQKAGDATFNETYKEVIEKQLRTFLRSPSAVYPQYSGFDLTEMKNEEKGKVEDIIALRKEIFETVAQAFRIPVTMMYGNITNMNEIVKVFLSLCIDPIADMISEEITRKYFTYDEWAKGYSVRVDTSCVNHLDLLDVAEKADKAVSSGVANIDEVRERLNMDTLDTEFSTHHYMTKNYSGIENILNNEEGGKTGE
jgi:hypothetical protein